MAGKTLGVAIAAIIGILLLIYAAYVSAAPQALPVCSCHEAGPQGCTACHKPGGIAALPTDELHITHQGVASCADCHVKRATVYGAGTPEHKTLPPEEEVTKEVCLKCHEKDVTDAIHKAHVEKLGCLDCHKPDKLKVTTYQCEKCHEKEVSDEFHKAHAGYDCFVCHTKEQAMPTTETCLKCHKDIYAKSDFHKKHEGVECTKCHTGEQLKPSAEICAECHKSVDEKHKAAFEVLLTSDCSVCHMGPAAETPPMACEKCHDKPIELIGVEGEAKVPGPTTPEFKAIHDVHPGDVVPCVGCHHAPDYWIPFNPEEPFGRKAEYYQKKQAEICLLCHYELTRKDEFHIIHVKDAIEKGYTQCQCLVCHNPKGIPDGFVFANPTIPADVKILPRDKTCLLPECHGENPEKTWFNNILSYEYHASHYAPEPRPAVARAYAGKERPAFYCITCHNGTQLLPTSETCMLPFCHGKDFPIPHGVLKPCVKCHTAWAPEEYWSKYYPEAGALGLKVEHIGG